MLTILHLYHLPVFLSNLFAQARLNRETTAGIN